MTLQAMGKKRRSLLQAGQSPPRNAANPELVRKGFFFFGWVGGLPPGVVVVLFFLFLLSPAHPSLLATPPSLPLSFSPIHFDKQNANFTPTAPFSLRLPKGNCPS